MGSYFNQFDCIAILCYNICVGQMRVIFEEHSNKHGLSAEDIAYAAEHIIKAQKNNIQERRVPAIHRTAC